MWDGRLKHKIRWGLCLPLTVDFLGEQGIDAGVCDARKNMGE